MNDGDWICSDPNCGNINFARRVSCYRCNKERPDSSKALKKKLGTEIGKTAAEKSRGLFNADDWQCNKCANVNWARRQTCNVCNAPKYGEVEARTGYGGGYNERGVVEYRRREPSSDDEYDEFGRKKRKRKADSQEKERPEKVGITEGAVFKNLPQTVPQKESNKEHMPVFASNLLTNTSNTDVKRNGSLSDSSMCELPLLTKAAVSRYQQINNQRQDYMLPICKTNDVPSRKRFYSTGDRDQSASTSYESTSKKSKRESTDSPILKMCNPVMENSVSSTKTETAYKFSRPNPAEDFQVTYTLEERIRTAAFAIAYNNCKITADKFETLYDKPAPDFKTIFAWRQRLITTGCLDDSHLETEKAIQTKCPITTVNTYTQDTKTVYKLPNPDEIVIASDSEEEESKNLEKSGRSMSAETLFIGGNTELQAPGSSASTVDGRGSRVRSCSQSTHHQTRSNSCDSQYSIYPDTDSEKCSKPVNTENILKTTNVSARQSVHGSESESVSYNSGEDNFLSRVFGEGRKRRKVKKRPIPAANLKLNDYASNDVNTFEGYSTIKKSEQSPLVTGNIYTNNLRNMNTRTRENVDIDGCSSEYVPTKVGSTAKKNYQEFKDNVRKKGYWAKGNGSSLTINRHNMSMNVIHKMQGIPNEAVEEPGKSVGTHQYPTVQAKHMKNQANDFTSGGIKCFTSTQPYLPFDNPIQTVKNTNIKDTASEDTDRIFALVQSHNASKTRSILDIFDISDPAQKSPERNNDLDKYDNIRRRYENEWDEDDEALYKKTDCDEGRTAPSLATSPTISNGTQSPTSDMLYTSEKDSQLQETCDKNLIPDFIKDKHDLLLDMLKDFQNKEISQMVSPLKHGTPQLQSAEDNNAYQEGIADTIPNNTMTGFELIPNILVKRPDSIPTLLKTSPDPIPIPTNPAKDRFHSSPNLTVKRNDTIPKYPMDGHARAPNKTINRSDLVSDHNKNRPDPVPNLTPGVSPISKQSMTSPGKVSNLTMNRSDMMQNLMTRPDPIPNLSRPYQGLIHTMSRSDLTQNTTPNRPGPISKLPMTRADRVSNHATRSDLNPNFTTKTPDLIPTELSNQVLSERYIDCEGSVQDASKTISPSKRVHILENITIQPGLSHPNITPLYQQNTIQHSSPEAAQTNNTKFVSSSPKVDENQDSLEKPPDQEQPTSPSVAQVDFSNLLAGINTNTLLLALQNLQQMTQSTSPVKEQVNTEQPSTEEQSQVAETINLTNDEEWEKESYRDGSIERQLEQMDGNPGDTPFLSDIFDPGPVIIPPNIVRKLNLNIPNLEGNGTDANTNSSETAPVIGNFKSFALPKPILLNRLKLTVKTAEKPTKSSGKRVKRKNKSKPSAASVPGRPEGDDDDDEESGDEADLSKYDLWGSDAEQGNSSKAENAEKTKDGEGAKEGGSDSQNNKNDKVSPNNKSKRRSRSSSSSSSSSSTSSSSHSSTTPQNKFDDFNLNSERESPPKGRKSNSRSRSPRRAPARRKSRDSRSAGEARSHESSRDKEYSRERERRDRSRGSRDERKERRYSREGGNHYNSRGRHR